MLILDPVHEDYDQFLASRLKWALKKMSFNAHDFLTFFWAVSFNGRWRLSFPGTLNWLSQNAKLLNFGHEADRFGALSGIWTLQSRIGKELFHIRNQSFHWLRFFQPIRNQ